ncbi:MAG TPA: ferritin-like domain-containing protein [Candidatus Acidoferrum sp.]|jgi:ferritin-like metal-binding protein YciE
MNKNTLRGLFVDELRDLYDAENRLVKAIPKMAKAASSEELRAGFEEHLEQTKEHVERLKQVLTSLGEKATVKKCPGIIGILEEGEEMMGEDFEVAVMDAALISAAQRVEHYEIAAYGCVHAWAQVLGEKSAASLLEKTLDEEKETDEKLTELAEEINAQANPGSKDDESAGSTKSSDEEENIDEDKPRSRTAGA